MIPNVGWMVLFSLCRFGTAPKDLTLGVTKNYNTSFVKLEIMIFFNTVILSAWCTLILCNVKLTDTFIFSFSFFFFNNYMCLIAIHTVNKVCLYFKYSIILFTLCLVFKVHRRNIAFFFSEDYFLSSHFISSQLHPQAHPPTATWHCCIYILFLLKSLSSLWDDNQTLAFVNS